MYDPVAPSLIIKIITKSKAKFWFFQMKTYILGEKYEISFELTNIKNEFKGGELRFQVAWPNGQQVINHFPIPPLKKDETYNTPVFETESLSEGYGLVFINMDHLVLDKDSEKITRKIVQFFSGPRVENWIDTRASVHSIKVKPWEEIYEFWALIIASIALFIIVLEKLFSLLDWIIQIL